MAVFGGLVEFAWSAVRRAIFGLPAAEAGAEGAPAGGGVGACPHFARTSALEVKCGGCSAFEGCHRCHNEQKLCATPLTSAAVAGIKCLKCRRNQPPAAACRACGARFAKVYCAPCKVWDEVDRHCRPCGVCVREGHAHCEKCAVCHPVVPGHPHYCPAAEEAAGLAPKGSAFGAAGGRGPACFACGRPVVADYADPAVRSACGGAFAHVACLAAERVVLSLAAGPGPAPCPACFFRLAAGRPGGSVSDRALRYVDTSDRLECADCNRPLKGWALDEGGGAGAKCWKCALEAGGPPSPPAPRRPYTVGSWIAVLSGAGRGTGGGAVEYELAAVVVAGGPAGRSVVRVARSGCLRAVEVGRDACACPAAADGAARIIGTQTGRLAAVHETHAAFFCGGYEPDPAAHDTPYYCDPRQGQCLACQAESDGLQDGRRKVYGFQQPVVWFRHGGLTRALALGPAGSDDGVGGEKYTLALWPDGDLVEGVPAVRLHAASFLHCVRDRLVRSAWADSLRGLEVRPAIDDPITTAGVRVVKSTRWVRTDGEKERIRVVTIDDASYEESEARRAFVPVGAERIVAFHDASPPRYAWLEKPTAGRDGRFYCGLAGCRRAADAPCAACAALTQFPALFQPAAGPPADDLPVGTVVYSKTRRECGTVAGVGEAEGAWLVERNDGGGRVSLPGGDLVTVSGVRHRGYRPLSIGSRVRIERGGSACFGRLAAVTGDTAEVLLIDAGAPAVFASVAVDSITFCSPLPAGSTAQVLYGVHSSRSCTVLKYLPLADAFVIVIVHPSQLLLQVISRFNGTITLLPDDKRAVAQFVTNDVGRVTWSVRGCVTCGATACRAVPNGACTHCQALQTHPWIGGVVDVMEGQVRSLETVVHISAEACFTWNKSAVKSHRFLSLRHHESEQSGFVEGLLRVTALREALQKKQGTTVTPKPACRRGKSPTLSGVHVTDAAAVIFSFLPGSNAKQLATCSAAWYTYGNSARHVIVTVKNSQAQPYDAVTRVRLHMVASDTMPAAVPWAEEIAVDGTRGWVGLPLFDAAAPAAARPPPVARDAAADAALLRGLAEGAARLCAVDRPLAPLSYAAGLLKVGAAEELEWRRAVDRREPGTPWCPLLPVLSPPPPALRRAAPYSRVVKLTLADAGDHTASTATLFSNMVNLRTLKVIRTKLDWSELARKGLRGRLEVLHVVGPQTTGAMLQFQETVEGICRKEPGAVLGEVLSLKELKVQAGQLMSAVAAVFGSKLEVLTVAEQAGATLALPVDSFPKLREFHAFAMRSPSKIPPELRVFDAAPAICKDVTVWKHRHLTHLVCTPAVPTFAPLCTNLVQLHMHAVALPSAPVLCQLFRALPKLIDVAIFAASGELSFTDRVVEAISESTGGLHNFSVTKPTCYKGWFPYTSASLQLLVLRNAYLQTINVSGSAVGARGVSFTVASLPRLEKIVAVDCPFVITDIHPTLRRKVQV
ncbi:putative RING finger protein C2F3.16 [Diplonema papillatum]|nr:putative RING finger protein C2F3.16 [Diplonema papillatum]